MPSHIRHVELSTNQMSEISIAHSRRHRSFHSILTALAAALLLGTAKRNHDGAHRIIGGEPIEVEDGDDEARVLQLGERAHVNCSVGSSSPRHSATERLESLCV